MRFLFGLALILLLPASPARAPNADSRVSFQPITLDTGPRAGISASCGCLAHGD
jgi:hypothetical protein